ncbi:MAG: glutathione peroxidase [Sphingobacteriia bacterium]|nr:glutathione peroxidase [Sphingobacteriia bacterium]
MTPRQSFLKAVYPILMLKEKLFHKTGNVLSNHQQIKPILSFYELFANANNGTTFSFSLLKGKNVMLVNTASNCGYTAQYAELEKLYEQQKGSLIILAFPSNDFKQQGQKSDEEIASFCKMNYGVSFPIMKKSVVIKNPEQNMVFEWLSNPDKNGWCSQAPLWNFSKYLINREGTLTHFFASTVSPLSKAVKRAIQEY